MFQIKTSYIGISVMALVCYIKYGKQSLSFMLWYIATINLQINTEKSDLFTD